TPLGGGYPGIDLGSHDHPGGRAGPRCRQDADQISDKYVRAIANHLSRWWLLGCLGPMGETTSPFRQTQAGDCAALRPSQRIQGTSQEVDRRTNLRLVF